MEEKNIAGSIPEYNENHESAGEKLKIENKNSDISEEEWIPEF